MLGSETARRAAWLALPLLAFLLARGILVVGAVQGEADPWAKSTWCRGDSGHYLQIAMSGYELYPCQDDPGEWCGNTSWFPAYPALVAGLRAAGVAIRPAALAVSAAFALATLWLLWQAGLSAGARGQGVLALLLAAVFPGMVYQHAAFPLSMFVFFATHCLLSVAAGRPLAGGVAGAVAAATYTPGVLLAPIVALALLLDVAEPSWKKRLTRALLTGALVSLGLLVTLLIQRVSVGSWQALALGHSSYRYILTDPISAGAAQIATLWRSGSPFSASASMENVVAFQSLVTALLVGAVLVAAARTGRSRRSTLLSLYVLAFWLFPILITEEPGDLPRRQSMLLPAVLLAPALPRALLVTLLLLCVLAAPAVVRLFVQTRLV